MYTNIKEVFVAILGSIGFSLVFNLKQERVLPSAIGGLIAWFTYSISLYLTSNIFLSSTISTFFICIFSEICARILLAPANIFLVPSIFPILQGGSLYYTMESIINGNNKLIKYYGLTTIKGTLGIVVGMILGTSFFYSIILNIIKYIKEKNKKRPLNY